MTIRSRLGMWSGARLAAVALWSVAQSASTQEVTEVTAEPALSAPELRGGGSWEPQGAGARAAQRWDIDVTRPADGSLTGRVTLGGSPLARTGTLSGKVDGTSVLGTISDERGQQVASFTGTVTRAGGLRGRYEDRTGEVGNWEWEGPLPR